ncbi:AAA family ATPase [Flavobacterium terrae]|uniref:AAA domain-containing protein, putative AbiEii toxin, Type IV TA system n=1 Tax=Flavobacterium terrae TaxID=415425 RepID=A0A1M6CVE3_9FLAO|nr:AAA family ATPase [Flavobacterium terrae]SHI64929.1 AAA domain-containing protein, putative AbiEii toxin, Type IV TA system [Flavobacterium terrae]
MSILNDIIDWVEDKPIFWQVAIDKLIRNNHITETEFLKLKEICKKEFGLSKIEHEDVNFDNLREYVDNLSNSNSITLSSILNVDNVNALSTTATLEFAPTGLTVVYGDNGSGKSSYVSILKHICNTRGQKPKINGNLFDPESSSKDKKAEVGYTLDGINFDSVELKNDVLSNSILKSVDVFDTFSANHYIEGEDEIAFIPQGLAIVEKFAIILKQIETEITSENQNLNLTRFDYSILQVDANSSAKQFLNNLNPNTTLDNLRINSVWNSLSEERIVELGKIILELKATDPQKLFRLNLERISRFKILINRFSILEKALSGDSLNSVKEILDNYVITSDTLKASSEKIFSNLPINGVGNDSWKQLWESARKFYNESKEKEIFPETESDSNCPLCLQNLSDEAKKHFIDFEDFVKQDIQKQYDNALRNYNELIGKLNNLSFDLDELNPTISEISNFINDYGTNQDLYLKGLSVQRDYLISKLLDKKVLASLTKPEIKPNARELIEGLIKRIEEENKKLSTQSIESELEPLEKELSELQGKKVIFTHKPKLAREIYRQKKSSLLAQCIAKCNTRTVTTISNQLTSTYVTQNLKQSFQNELTKLGFRNIKIETETRGAKGKQYHFLKLNEPNSTGVVLKDILSEGEHRCIALSTFLSELSLSEHNSSIIFDDPVSSLDHKWRDKIARRISEESKNRQVIVFTHDISFLLMIQEHAEKLDCELDIKSLTRKKIETGIIASNPPWDALPVGKRIGILKADYQILEKIERTETEEVYNEKVKVLYGKLRETWERFVEEVFLNSTVQRFGREIQTKRLAKVIDLTIVDYTIVDDNMSKCSTYFLGHDSAGELIATVPDSQEFLSDINILEEFTKTIRNRRNK